MCVRYVLPSPQASRWKITGSLLSDSILLFDCFEFSGELSFQQFFLQKLWSSRISSRISKKRAMNRLTIADSAVLRCSLRVQVKGQAANRRTYPGLEFYCASGLDHFHIELTYKFKINLTVESHVVAEACVHI